MKDINVKNKINTVIQNMPKDWLNLTTHRLDTYNEKLAKVEFLQEFEKAILEDSDSLGVNLNKLPTAFDYIRLGHPLSCVLEWTVGREKQIDSQNIISFASNVMPILAILRHNLFKNIKTKIVLDQDSSVKLNVDLIKNVYNYDFEVSNIQDVDCNIFDGTTVFVTKFENAFEFTKTSKFDFNIYAHQSYGSITVVNHNDSKGYIDEIQHVRRRESIAMTPVDCFSILNSFVSSEIIEEKNNEKNFKALSEKIQKISNTTSGVSIGSSGLSVQYAIMMGLIQFSQEMHKEKQIKFIVPPNCYGGTNDQARRVAACNENVEVLDLPVDGGQDMVQSIEKVLQYVASIDAIPFIIAEIPTNPRVEVPELLKLRETLAVKRNTNEGKDAIAPVFILDQTFCPNVEFLGDNDYLGSIQAISYVSGSKFPSGGLCTAGYCVVNKKAQHLINYINQQLELCDNQATSFQVKILNENIPTMIERIDKAYVNTRDFVSFIQKTLPAAKINFVSEELAKQGFTPSVFSLDLPTKGENHEEKESYKRDLNLKLINLMIQEIPQESKYCVSYGQLKGCYWTIPATSTQGTTKEGDKDYIVRVSISPQFDLKRHQDVFQQFCHKFMFN